VAANIALPLDHTEYAVLNEALTHYTKQLHRTQHARRETLARVADELRDAAHRAGTPHSDADRLVPLSITDDGIRVLTDALDAWARHQEAAATETDDPGHLEELASIARSLLLVITVEVIHSQDN
jgi:hypothetical protein